MIKLDFNETFSGKVEDGVYEAVITKVNEDATQTGTDFTNFELTIRNDVQQEFKNMKVWHRAWVTKATGKYNMIIFNTIGKAAGLGEGPYNSFDQLLQAYVNKPVKITVKNETSEHNGKTYENTNIKAWEPTDFPNVQHQFKNDSNQGNAMPEAIISDDDMPF